VEEIQITVVGGRNLVTKKNAHNVLNGYCTLNCTFSKQRFKTPVIKKTSFPTWNQTFRFLFHRADIENGEISLKLMHKEFLRSSCVGILKVKLSGLINQKDEWFPVMREPKKKYVGDVHLKIILPNANGLNSIGRVDSAIGRQYEIGDEIGKGGFSVVKKCVDVQSGIMYAMKTIQKKYEEDVIVGKREIMVMKHMKHRNIIRLYDIFETPREMSLIMEYANAGEIFDVIASRGPFSEPEVARIIQQILSALEYMHNMGFVHRDLKPENILMSLEDGEFVAKLADFGLAKDYEDEVLMTFCGTPDYIAPEILRGEVGYTYAVDLWSLGVLTYTLLCGTPAFAADKPNMIFTKIISADFNFDAPEWKDISALSKDFISRMIKLDPEERLDASVYLKHPWIVDFSQRRDTKPTVDISSFNSKFFAEYKAKRTSERKEVFSSAESSSHLNK